MKSNRLTTQVLIGEHYTIIQKIFKFKCQIGRNTVSKIFKFHKLKIKYPLIHFKIQNLNTKMAEKTFSKIFKF